MTKYIVTKSLRSDFKPSEQNEKIRKDFLSEFGFFPSSLPAPNSNVIYVDTVGDFEFDLYGDTKYHSEFLPSLAQRLRNGEDCVIHW